tara:strand:- start:1841 stop:3340 length:1500 start_codon:yes stop_codon:yes gene_type:complete
MKNYIFSLKAWQLSILSGLIIGLSYLPIHLGFCVYFGFIPLIHAWVNGSCKNNFKFGYLFGLVYNIISNYWIGANSGADIYVVQFSLISAVMYLSIFWGIAGWIVGKIKNNSDIYLYIPLLFVSLEWVRSFGALGFAWGNLAITQTKYLPILQFIDYGGTYLITFLVGLVNVILYKMFYYGFVAIIRQTLLVFLIIIFMLAGWIKLSEYPISSKVIDVAVIQPNIDPNKKWDYSTRESTINIMDSLHNKAITLDPKIILFPETALPTYLTMNNRIRNNLQQKVNNSGVPILIGTVDRLIDSLGNKIYFNSSMFISPNSDYLMYEKIHLVPFAEYDLLPNLLIPLDKLNLNLNRGVFMSGNEFDVFDYDNIMFSNLICYESSFPRYSRGFIKRGAELLMIQANDGWLGNTAGPYQHFELARLRAIENRVSVIRSGNTGISGIITPTGAVQKKISLNKQEVFSEKVAYGHKKTFYTKYGDVFAALCFVIFIFIGPVKCIKK